MDLDTCIVFPHHSQEKNKTKSKNTTENRNNSWTKYRFSKLIILFKFIDKEIFGP